MTRSRRWLTCDGILAPHNLGELCLDIVSERTTYAIAPAALYKAAFDPGSLVSRAWKDGIAHQIITCRFQIFVCRRQRRQPRRITTA